ncbi:MAG: tRNA guanosine(15) transglycosylase TgtA [Thermoplasmata archaeon]
MERDGLARIARFETPHGIIETPTVLPVINPNLMDIKPEEMKKFGLQGVITNSYIIRRTEALRDHALKYGVHSLIDYYGPIMTDSGTFQSYVYGSVEYGNREIVEFQKKIGSDISTILDIFTTPETSRSESEKALIETYERMKAVEDLDGITAAPIQGSIYPDLRRKSAELMSSTNAAYLPVGGVVPLLESYNYEKLVDIILASKLNSSFNKPIHLFGGGHPMFFALSIYMGVDLFDSASYIKYAKDGRIIYPDGTRDISKIKEFPSWSPLNGKYTARDILDLDSNSRYVELSKHNLAAIFMEINEIKERIYEQSLSQYINEKSRTHPALQRAYVRLMEYSKEIMKFQELYKKTPFYYFDYISSSSPYVEKMKSYTAEYLNRNKKTTYIFDKKSWKPGFTNSSFIKSVYEKRDVNALIPWSGIYVPAELENSYPVEQTVSSGLEPEPDEGMVKSIISPFTTEKFKNEVADSNAIRNFDLNKIRAIADLQFGYGRGQFIFSDDVKIVKSKTGRIRNIFLNGKNLATLRNDGFFTLSFAGAKLLFESIPGTDLKVFVKNESAEYNAQGKSVFFKFIISCDRNIIPKNETLIVDEQGDLVAVGKATVSGKEMTEYKEGIAVNVHEGKNHSV